MKKEETMEARWSRARVEALGWLAGLAIGLVACALLGSCKGTERVVERVREVHDTAFSVKDSIVYRTLAFGGEVEERSAEWTSRGDSASNAPDTVWRWRYRTVRAQGTDSSHTAVKAASARHVTDSTATTTGKRTVRAGKRPPGKGKTAWVAVLWLLGVAAAFGGGVALGTKARKQ